MGKSRTDKNGYTREQKLTKENQQLKRTISSLKKQLARIDLDRYEQVREIIEEHYSKDRKDEGQAILDNLKDQWKCHEAGCQGHLRITLFNKVNQVHYFRKCSSPNCPNRTKSQKYDPKSVKGILNE
jgi:hypothetical protein